MNKLVLLAGLFLFSLTPAAFASDAGAFQVDRQQLKSEFSRLDQLENIVIQNDFISLKKLRAEGKLPAGLQQTSMPNAANPMEPPLGIPGFFWGCAMGPLGILFAYVLSENDKAEAKSALIGCIVASGSMTLICVIYYMLILAVYSTY